MASLILTIVAVAALALAVLVPAAAYAAGAGDHAANRMVAAGLVGLAIAMVGMFTVGGDEVSTVDVTVTSIDGERASASGPDAVYRFDAASHDVGDELTVTLNDAGLIWSAYTDRSEARTAVAAEQARPGTPTQRAAMIAMVAVAAMTVVGFAPTPRRREVLPPVYV